MEKSKLNRFIAFILLIIVLILVYLGIVAIVFYRKEHTPIYFNSTYDYIFAIDKLENEFDNKIEAKSKKYYKETIEKELGLKHYIYAETKLSKYSGLTFPTIRTIIIDEEIHGYDYCSVMAHEAIHLKEFVKSENYVTWKTFLYLYESEELHNVGVWFALRQIYQYYDGEYNISDLVVYYLTNK